MIKEIPKYRFQYIYREPKGGEPPAMTSESEAVRVEAFHKQLPGYHVTNLARLSNLANVFGVGDIFVKDESTRFGLQAFKVLGGSYATAHLVCNQLGVKLDDVTCDYLVSEEVKQKIGQITLTTATDGNHGRGVAWAAQQLGQNAVIYMPKGSAQARVKNIEALGATVKMTDVNYDDTVRMACQTAKENGWFVVQDTAWEGYTETPMHIMQGYMTMCVETFRRMEAVNERPTHVFVQAGVGALAGAVVGFFVNKYQENPPKFIVMEPDTAACFFKSAAEGEIRIVGGDLETSMVGLACGEPSSIAWPILRDFPCCYVTLDNYVAANAVRMLTNPLPGDPAIEAGESGACGIGLVDLLMNCDAFKDLKNDLQLGPESKLLFFNTEGVTDPVNVREIVWHGKYPSLHMV